jgi:hypothetical protein
LIGHPMKRQMKKVYTRKLFNDVFQHELQLSSSYYICSCRRGWFDRCSIQGFPKAIVWHTNLQDPSVKGGGIVKLHLFQVLDRFQVVSPHTKGFWRPCSPWGAYNTFYLDGQLSQWLRMKWKSLPSLFKKRRLQAMGSILFVIAGCAPTLIRLWDL